MKILIVNEGCHDETYTELEVNEQELATITRLAIENNKNSTYGCKPKINLYIRQKINGVYKDTEIDTIEVEEDD